MWCIHRHSVSFALGQKPTNASLHMLKTKVNLNATEGQQSANQMQGIWTWTWTWKTFVRQNSTQNVQKNHKNETLKTSY